MQARQQAAAAEQRLEAASARLAASQEAAEQLRGALESATSSAGSLQGALAAQQATSAQLERVSLSEENLKISRLLTSHWLLTPAWHDMAGSSCQQLGHTAAGCRDRQRLCLPGPAAGLDPKTTVEDTLTLAAVHARSGGRHVRALCLQHPLTGDF